MTWKEVAGIDKDKSILFVTVAPIEEFPIAAASVNSFYGCIHFSMRTVYKVVKELLESLACMGFQNVVVVASHADPEHQIVVEKAVRSVNRKYGEIAIAPMGAFSKIPNK